MDSWGTMHMVPKPGGGHPSYTRGSPIRSLIEILGQLDTNYNKDRPMEPRLNHGQDYRPKTNGELETTCIDLETELE